MKLSSQPARGMRDYLPAELRRREHVIDVIRSAYELHGFVPLETPAVERLEVLAGKYGEEGDQLIFRILKRGQKLNDSVAELVDESDPRAALADLALRYDLTVPRARVVAEYQNDIPRYFKRFQIQPVWRADRPQRGRFREFFQCDVDFVGSRSLVAEWSVTSAVRAALGALGFEAFDVRVNDRRVLTGLMEVADVPEEARSGVFVAIDKLDKIGLDDVRRELRNAGLSDAQLDTLRPALEAPAAGKQDDAARLDALDPLFAGVSSTGAEGLGALRELFALFDSDEELPGSIYFDPTLARGLSYYTGPIFEIAIEGAPGSVGGGGRYDELVGMFLGQSIPAVGFSLGLERILGLMEEREMFPALGGACDFLMTRLDDEAIPRSQRILRALRRSNVRCELFPDDTRLGKQFRYAESIGVRFVGILGGRELGEGHVAIKDLQTGDQTNVPFEQVTEWILERIPG